MRRSPRLLHYTFLSFNPQPRHVPSHRFRYHFNVTGDFRLRRTLAGSSLRTAETGSLYYRPTIRFRLLPTPPHDDAVTFGYQAVVYLDTDFHRADVMPSRAY